MINLTDIQKESGNQPHDLFLPMLLLSGHEFLLCELELSYDGVDELEVVVDQVLGYLLGIVDDFVYGGEDVAERFGGERQVAGH